MSRGDGNSESSPLLRRLSPTPTLTAELEDESTHSASPSASYKTSQTVSVAQFVRDNVTAILYLYLLIVEFGNYLQAAPRAAIFENIICHERYINDSSDLLRGHGEDVVYGSLGVGCKGASVQDELAFVRGMQEMFDCLPGLFLAMPYGHLANRHGRKLILFAAVAGMCLQYTWVLIVTWFSSTLQLRLIWLSSLFLVLGGGQSVSRSLAFVIVSDVTSEKKRATVFFRVEAVTLIARAAASALSSFLMTDDPWMPMVLGLGFIYLGSLFVLLLPASTSSEHTPSHDRNIARSADVEADETSSLPSAGYSRRFERMWKTIWKAMSQDSRIILLLALAIIGQLSSRTTGLLLQYAAKRYFWTFARANMLLVLRMMVTVVALLVLIPLLTSSLPRLPSLLRPASKDLFLARLSTILLATGLAFMALASKPVLMIVGVTIFSCGFGTFSALRSVLTTVVLQRDRATYGRPSLDQHRSSSNVECDSDLGGEERDHISILYAAMSLGQTVAKAAGPIYATLFQIGQRWGGMGQGLPFGIAAVLAMLVHCALWYVAVGGG